MTTWGLLVCSTMALAGCGGAPKNAASPATSSSAPGAPSDTTADAGAGVATGKGAAAIATAAAPANPPPAAAPDAPAAAPAAPAPPQHPFASNGAEATSLIDDAITSRVNEVTACVEAARTRRKSPHEKIVVEIGIDQEGHMLGVKLPKGEKHDKELVDCILDALRPAPFPRSHSGVITVRKTFEDKEVYR
jgi:hypothetical protein